jgi:hypothetical protein
MPAVTIMINPRIATARLRALSKLLFTNVSFVVFV